MSRNGTATYDPRQLWAAMVAPLVTAAREGAAHAARTAERERARARQEPRWWRQRWVVITAAGLVVAGAAGGAYAVVAKRRSAADQAAEPQIELEPVGSRAAGGTTRGSGAGGVKSTVEAGRDKVADLARTMMHKIRRNGDGDGDNGDGTGAAAEPHTAPLTPAAPDESRWQAPTTGTGYGDQH